MRLRNCILAVFLALQAASSNVVDAVCHAYHYTPDDCGLVEEIPGDTRTQIPWAAGIFVKNERDEYLHATGTILGPTTVITVFTGRLEKLARKIRGKGTNTTTHNFLLVAGLRSGNLSERDQHTQFAEIAFIEPHLSHDEGNKDFHFVLFHLKTTLDFSTPYVKSVCLPHFQLGRRFSNETKEFLHGGFIKRSRNRAIEGGGLEVQLVDTGMGYECVKMYEKYYPGVFPVGMFCAVVPQPEVENLYLPSSGCLMQGSAIVQKIGHHYYLAGLTTFIRGRKGGLCRNGTVYFNTRLSIVSEWVEKSMRCSPFSFPCSDGSCIPLESVCNSVRNCLDTDTDEGDILCESNRKCGDDQHQCNIVGGCISKDQVCDGVRDCEEGSDESPLLCNRELSSRSSRDISFDGGNIINDRLHQHCRPLEESDGVQIEYVAINRNGLANCSYIPEGTFAISKCKMFYKSTQIQSRLEQQCTENGKWSDHAKLECKADCGILNKKSSSLMSWKNVNDSSDLSEKVLLPWHTLLFNLDSSTKKIQFVCGGTMISSRYLITSGHCFGGGQSLKSFKVVVGGISKNFFENLHHDRPFITEIDNVWRPDEFDMKSRLGDVALVKMKRPLSFGALIRPACFLDDDNGDESNNVAG